MGRFLQIFFCQAKSSPSIAPKIKVGKFHCCSSNIALKKDSHSFCAKKPRAFVDEIDPRLFLSQPQSEDGPEHAGAVKDSKPSPKKRGRPARKCRSK